MFPVPEWNHYEDLTSGLALMHNTSEGKILRCANLLIANKLFSIIYLQIYLFKPAHLKS
jgi:hypothetical protein